MADYFEERGVDTTREEDREETFRNHFMRLLADFNMFSEMGIENQLAPPAAKTAVESLPNEIVAENGGQCHICLKEYEKNESTRAMPCKHSFHSTCINMWLEKTNSCPLCRHELPTDNQLYEAYRKEKIRAKERESDLESLHNSMFT